MPKLDVSIAIEHCGVIKTTVDHPNASPGEVESKLRTAMNSTQPLVPVGFAGGEVRLWLPPKRIIGFAVDIV